MSGDEKKEEGMPGAGGDEEEFFVDTRSFRERAYDWLYDHHVTVKVMDAVIAVLIIFGIAAVIIGMMVGQ